LTAAIYNEINPIGFDYQVLQMQNNIGNLNFIEAIFGVAHVQFELRDNREVQDSYLNQDMGKHGPAKHERWYPQARKNLGRFIVAEGTQTPIVAEGGSQYIIPAGSGNGGSDVDLTIDDSYTSRVFFLAKDPISTSPSQDKYDPTERNPEIKQPFSILLHCNLQKIFNLGIGLTNQEQVKLSFLYALNKNLKVIVSGMSENIDNFWKEFSITPEINGFGRYPFYTLRIEADCYFYAFPNNGSNVGFNPKQFYTKKSIIPNSVAGYGNVN
jgi:hypothetical protein